MTFFLSSINTYFPLLIFQKLRCLFYIQRIVLPLFISRYTYYHSSHLLPTYRNNIYIYIYIYIYNDLIFEWYIPRWFLLELFSWGWWFLLEYCICETILFNIIQLKKNDSYIQHILFSDFQSNTTGLLLIGLLMLLYHNVYFR